MALSVLSQRGPTHALAYRTVSAPLAARMLQAQTQQFAYPACTRHRKVRPTLPPLQWSQSQQEQQATQAMKELSVSNVMVKEPVCLKAIMPIKDAIKCMLDNDISGAPVVDSAGKLVGILSESDLIWKGAGTPLDHYLIPPTYIGIIDSIVQLRDKRTTEEEIHKILSRTVADAMSKEVVSITPNAPLSAAASLMLSRKINRLPVVDGEQLVGVITRHDVLKGIYDTKTFL